MTDRVKSNSGVGLDLLANPTKTRKVSGNGFSSNQNINLNDATSDGNDNDSYTFKVNDYDDVRSTNIDDTGISNLETLNNYHDTFTSPKKSVPLFKSRNESMDSDRYDHNIKEKIINEKRHEHDHKDSYRNYDETHTRSFSVHKEDEPYNHHGGNSNNSGRFGSESDNDFERHAKYSESH